jgi:hypothetical protein
LIAFGLAVEDAKMERSKRADFVRTTRDGSEDEGIHNDAPFKKLGRAIAHSGARDCPKSF